MKLRPSLSRAMKFFLGIGRAHDSPEQTGDPFWMHNDAETRRLGYRLVIILVVIVFGWGACAPIDSAAIAPGTVRVQGDHRGVQHLEGGIVSDIFVKNGDYVSEGQPLVQMDTTLSDAELRILEGKRFNLVARVDRLVAERDDAPELVFSAYLAEFVTTDSRAADAVQGASTLFAARRADLEGEISVVEQRIDQLDQKIVGLKALRASEQRILNSLDVEIGDLESLLSEGYVDRQRIRELERTRSKVLGNFSDIESQIASGQIAMEEARLQVLQIVKRYKTEVIDQLRTVQEALYDVEQQVLAASDRVRRATVRSPSNGVVLGMQTKTEGAVIGAGQEIMRIVPSVDALVVDAQVSPLDIDRLSIGQSAEIRLAVFKDAYLVSGALTNLSADSLIDESSGMAYFQAEVEISFEDLALLGDVTLVPGMPAEVLIKTGERTMLGYLTSPMNRVFSRSLIED